MRLARYLRKPLKETRRSVSSAEFILWAATFYSDDEKEYKKEYESTQKWEEYAAQIAYWVWASIPSEHKKKREMSDFLFKYEGKKEKSEGQEKLELMQSKMGWFGIVGMNKEGQPDANG